MDFFEIAKTGAALDIKAAIRTGADVNARGKDDWTPLMFAAMHNESPEVITVLLKAGADVKAKSKEGRTAFECAQEYTKLKGTDVLLKLGGLKDFRDVYPEFCAVRTSLRTSQIDPTWVRNVLCLVLGTHLNYSDINQVRFLLTIMETSGFRFLTISETPESEIVSGFGDEDTVLVSGLGMENPRCVSLIMKDPLGKTSLIRFCFFFKT